MEDQAGSYEMPIERGHVAVFARAIGDSNPVYTDVGAARAAGFADVIAPPTFVEAYAHFDPRSGVRPHDGQPWFGSGAAASGDPEHDAGGGTAFHAETHLTYHEPAIVVGQTLTVIRRPGSEWSKAGGRGGALHFHDWSLEFRDPGGRLLVTLRTVAVQTERKVPVGATAEIESSDRLSELPASTAAELAWPAVGERFAVRALDELTRTRIVQYAGASGDFSPQHTDEYYNVHAAGYPSVFGHGMLSMAIAGRALTDRFGVGVLQRMSARFVGQTWPGDALAVSVDVVGGDPRAGSRELVYEVFTARQTVIRGTAAVARPSMTSAQLRVV